MLEKVAISLLKIKYVTGNLRKMIEFIRGYSHLVVKTKFRKSNDFRFKRQATLSIMVDATISILVDATLPLFKMTELEI